jgi:hypothetical protein
MEALMRKSILAAFAAASLFAVPAYAADVMLPAAPVPAPPPPTAAPPTVAGYVGVYGGGVWSGGTFFPAVAFDLAVAKPLDRMDVQFEVRDLTIFDAGDIVNLAAAIIHAYRRNAGAAVGAFGGYEAVFTAGSLANVFHLGAEAAMFRGRATLYAQLAAVLLTGGGTTAWGAYVRGLTRFFPSDNVRLEAGVRYLYLAGGGVTSVVTPELEAEFQLPGRSLSFLTTARATFVVGAGAAAYTALAGIRFNFGGGDLIDQGAPMDTMPLLF